jgi:Dual specificity phosphatase, catalytic domain
MWYRRDTQKHTARVYGSIFIGSIFALDDDVFFAQNNVRLVVKCDRETPFKRPNVLTIAVPEFSDALFIGEDAKKLVNRIEFILEAMHKFVSENPDVGVLVHCMAGENRSALAIGIYLRKYFKMTYDETKKLLDDANKTRGCRALWNPCFEALLKEYK